MVCDRSSEVAQEAVRAAVAVRAAMMILIGLASLEITGSNDHEENALLNFDYWLAENLIAQT